METAVEEAEESIGAEVDDVVLLPLSTDAQQQVLVHGVLPLEEGRTPCDQLHFCDRPPTEYS